MSDSRRKIVYAKKISLDDLDSINGGAVNSTVRAGEVPRRVDEVLRGVRSSLTDPSLLDQFDPTNGRILPRTPTVRDPSETLRDPSGAQRVSDALNDVTGNRGDRPTTTPRVTTPRVTTPSVTTPERITGHVPLPTPRPAGLGETVPLPPPRPPGLGGPFTGHESEVAVAARLGNDERFQIHPDVRAAAERQATGQQLQALADNGYRPLYGSDQEADAAWQARVDQNIRGTAPQPTLRYASDQDADLAWAQRQANDQQSQAAQSAFASTGRPLYASDEDADAAYQARVDQNLRGTTSTPEVYGPPIPSDYVPPAPAVPPTVPSTGNPVTRFAEDTSSAPADTAPAAVAQDLTTPAEFNTAGLASEYQPENLGTENLGDGSSMLA